MKIRPKTFKLLKELLLEKGGVFYNDGKIIDFMFYDDGFYETGGYCIEYDGNFAHWLSCDDWYIKV